MRPANPRATAARFREVVQRGLARADQEHHAHIASLKPGAEPRGVGVRSLSGNAGKQWRAARREATP